MSRQQYNIVIILFDKSLFASVKILISYYGWNRKDNNLNSYNYNDLASKQKSKKC